MNTLEAFKNNMSTPDGYGKVFDWLKAAKIIKERKPKQVLAGLENDFEWTGGVIFENGKPIYDSYTYLYSRWAIPQMEIDGELIDCWLSEHVTDWSASTKWPKEALAILKSK